MCTVLSLDTVKSQNLSSVFATFFYFLLHYLFVILICLLCYFVFIDTMAEANSIHDIPRENVQSILEGYSDNDSDRSLPQVPNETLGLSSV